ncbi:hypothetical protein LCGC14_2395540 [marine sediment metagenome]|uniref:Uncharacterized protein n=1 Tax=marine sediment metagenome TaxID=412755 RepID=A0A0F9CIZ5_9ZZZZ
MANKSLVMDAYEDDMGYKNLTLLSGSVKDEVVYAEFHSTNQGEKGADIIEIAVNVEEMIKARDFLNIMISKIGPAEAI